MTREEAIEVIKAYKDKLTNSASNQLDRDIEAFDMAIKALKQKPCDDAISRQALLRKMNTKTHEYGNGLGFRTEWIMLINSMPTILPKRKQGEWIEEFNDMEGEVRFYCSSCGDYQMFETDFCSNCGAEMRSEVIE